MAAVSSVIATVTTKASGKSTFLYADIAPADGARKPQTFPE